MATRALDIVTILRALITLNDELTATLGWQSENPQQKQIFVWLKQYREVLAKITGLDALASSSYQELNKFLENHDLAPVIKPFKSQEGGKQELGVVAILDKLVRWKDGPGRKVEIDTEKGKLPGFRLPEYGVEIYQVDGYPDSYLLELLTKSDDTLWLFIHDDDSIAGLDLVKLSMKVMSKPRKISKYPGVIGNNMFAGAKVPMLDFDVQPDLSWLLGANMTTTQGEYYFIGQASQRFKMRMDETGARVKVATGMVRMTSSGDEPKIFIVDRPFYGWWTQKGIDLPMAVFFADWDALRKPAGSLEDL